MNPGPKIADSFREIILEGQDMFEAGKRVGKADGFTDCYEYLLKSPLLNESARKQVAAAVQHKRKEERNGR